MNDIKDFLKQMQKEFGDNAVFTLKDIEQAKVEVIPTGSLALDIALGVGGIPRGRLTELYGQEAVGKTTLCYHILSEAQKQNLNVLFVDMENAVDLSYARDIGVDVDNVYWNQPLSMEEALGVVGAGIKSGVFGLIILDSIGSLAPIKEMEDTEEKANVALVARALAKFFRIHNHDIRENNVAVLFTNQIRDKIGSFYATTTTPGGHAKNHARSVAMSMRRNGDIKDGKSNIGFTAEVDIKKNKLASPFKTASLDIIYGKGIDAYRDMVEVAKNLGVVTLKGSYYVYIDESLGQGKDNAAETLRNNPTMVESVRNECFRRMGKE
jgi:recombination protein RecA